MDAPARYGVFLSILLLVNIAAGQSVSTLMGAENAGVSYASATLTNAWSIHNNVGTLADDSALHVAMSYELSPSIPGGNRLAAAVSAPIGRGAAGAGIFRFGDEVYDEQIISLGYGHRLGIAALGLKVNYIQYRAEGFGVKYAFSITLGGVVHLGQRFIIGAYATNINRPIIAQASRERLPTLLVVGVQFKASNKVAVLAEVEKDLEYRPTIKGGVMYRPLEKLVVSAGFNLDPYVISFAAGYRLWRINIAYAVQYDFRLSIRHQASAGFYLTSFGKRK